MSGMEKCHQIHNAANIPMRVEMIPRSDVLCSLYHWCGREVRIRGLRRSAEYISYLSCCRVCRNTYAGVELSATSGPNDSLWSRFLVDFLRAPQVSVRGVHTGVVRSSRTGVIHDSG
jgi:hypothetical protein